MSLAAKGGQGALVIGYGNTLRGDDGIGPHVAAQLEALSLPGVRLLQIQQLLPELCEELAGTSLAVFVDACARRQDPPVLIARLEAAGGSGIWTHSLAPGQLLGMTRLFHDQAPEAWLVSVAGEDFGLREGLSETGERHVRLAALQVAALLNSRRHAEAAPVPAGGGSASAPLRQDPPDLA